MASSSSKSKEWPPGFRFRPTDQELVGYYLTRKVSGRHIQAGIIAEVDLYKCEPWDLPDKSLFESDVEWYFFSPRDKKYPNGSRTNRATETGYWKATGKDRVVRSGSKGIGMKKTLVFYKGRAPHGKRTDWIMHEYRLEEGDTYQGDGFVVCRVFRKSAAKNEEESPLPNYPEPEDDSSLAFKQIQRTLPSPPVVIEPEPEPEICCPPAPAAVEAPPADDSLDAFLMMLLEPEEQTLEAGVDQQNMPLDEYLNTEPEVWLQQTGQQAEQHQAQLFSASNNEQVQVQSYNYNIVDELLAGDFIEMNDLTSVTPEVDLSGKLICSGSSTQELGGEVVAADEDGEDGPLKRFLNMLGSVHVLPASAAEHPSKEKLHLKSMNVHVTLTCSSCPRQHVHPENKSNKSSELKQHKKKTSYGGNILFVFLVGSMSALFWILLLPGMSRVAGYLQSVLLL